MGPGSNSAAPSMAVDWCWVPTAWDVVLAVLAFIGWAYTAWERQSLWDWAAHCALSVVSTSQGWRTKGLCLITIKHFLFCWLHDWWCWHCLLQTTTCWGFPAKPDGITDEEMQMHSKPTVALLSCTPAERFNNVKTYIIDDSIMT